MAEAIQHAQHHMDALHEVAGMAAGLVPAAEALDQARQHRQQPRVLLIVPQQPAAWSYISMLACA